MIAYDTSHIPPAPIADVTLASIAQSRRRRSLPGLLDTGSDITAIPSKLNVLNRYYALFSGPRLTFEVAASPLPR